MESIFVFIFSFLLSTQLGKHFFFPFSYLSGIRIDYLAPTLYLTDLLSLAFIFYFLFRCVISAKVKVQTLIFQFKKGNFRMDPLLQGDDIQKYIFLFLLILMIYINYFFALSKPLWFYSAFKIAQWVSIFYFFMKRAKNKSVFSAVLLGLLFGGVVQLILSLLQLADRHSVGGIWYYLGERSFSIFTSGIAKAYFMGHEFLRPYGTFSHPNSLAGFYVLIYTFVLTQKRIINPILKVIALTLFSFLILVSFSRTAIAVYVFINLLFVFKNSLSCRVCSLAKILVACVLVFFVMNISGDTKSMQKRDDFAQKSLAIIATKPLSGVGAGSYLIAQHNYPQKFSTFFEQPVHNIFLLTGAQFGIPLSILLVTLIIRIIRVKIKQVSFFIPLLVVILTGSMDHYWLTLQQNVLVSAVVFGILNRYETKAT